ncbi:hypothetical protein LWC34_00350 [Kibdelosporangium philippinense]|uniref:DUF3558 domain-containing protein n=2 Tax=Kibdelosporangium philippinense TaxID=211113 RepID=A0ABS8Z1R3_9PSEU|nr:hypothetical protein [Kibdelosporangium philippinense]MCE7001297.1 hypothetical protein [Kibdelosporangium philippinense]
MLSTGCGLLSDRAAACTEKLESMSKQFAESDLLGLTPAGAKNIDKYVTTPCQDDDQVGRIGVSFDFTGDVLSYYDKELTARGWEPRGGGPRFEPGEVLDVGRPQQCFEDTRQPGVVLNVFVGVPKNFLEFQLNDAGMACAELLK